MGRERFAVMCKILLMVFHREQGTDEEKWISEEYDDFLVVDINL